MRLNWANYKFLNVDGYGRMGAGFVRALLQNGHDTYPFTIDALDNPTWMQRAQGIGFDRTTVQLMPPHHMRHLPGRSVGFSMHESMTLPRDWADHVNQKCQFFIVPSPWLIEVFQDAGVKVPIEVVTGGIDPDECKIAYSRQSRPYTFICLADRGDRKGWDKVWTAFYEAFDFANKDVRLIIKCRPGSLPKLDFSYSRDPRLTVWRDDVDTADVFAQADAAINPNRCEGLGMWPREAAACGLPVVVTNHFGTCDETEQWAYPLNKFTLIESGMIDCGGKWVDPSLDEVIEKMRWLYTHQDEAKAFGLQSAQWMRDHRTYQHAANRLVETLNGWLGGAPPIDDSPLTSQKLTALPTKTILTAGNGQGAR